MVANPIENATTLWEQRSHQLRPEHAPAHLHQGVVLQVRRWHHPSGTGFQAGQCVSRGRAGAERDARRYRDSGGRCCRGMGAAACWRGGPQRYIRDTLFESRKRKS